MGEFFGHSDHYYSAKRRPSMIGAGKLCVIKIRAARSISNLQASIVLLSESCKLPQ